MKTLVVYYSRKGYTEKVALARAKELGADFLAIDTLKTTVGYDGFINCMQAALTKKDMELFPYDTDVASYEKVIICAPIWRSDICAPMKTFMKKEKHNIQKAEYIFLHAFDESVQKAVDEADKILRLKRDKYTSIQCVLGKIKKEEEFCDA